MPRYDLAIFDFDGTLADSGGWAIAELRAAASRFGFHAASDDEVAMLRGRTTQEIMKYLGIPFWKVPRITAYMRERMAASTDQIALFAGVSGTLAALASAGIRLAIVSSNSEHNVRRILGGENTARIAFFSCGIGMFGKARRLRALVRASGVEPSRAIYVGDEARDIEAAREAGTHSAAVAWGYATADSLARFSPTFVFETWDAAAAQLLGSAPG